VIINGDRSLGIEQYFFKKLFVQQSFLTVPFLAVKFFISLLKDLLMCYNAKNLLEVDMAAIILSNITARLQS
jgi:hypothetical protein